MNEFNPHSLEPFWKTWYIDSLIGTGGFGAVYKIYREEFGKRYYSALKIISVPKTVAEEKQAYYEGADKESARQYFREVVEVIYREIAIMSELKGKTNIVSYEDHEIIEKKDSLGFHILIRMELLESLNDHILCNNFSITDVVNMGKDLCKALILCQRRNLIHRDIKPGNIFVTSDGDYKLGDFGIARQMEGTQGDLTIVGTFEYMAPEVRRGNTYDGRVDIYSLGIVLYYYLNDKRGPFSSTSSKTPSYSEKQESMLKRFRGEKLNPPTLASNRLAEVIIKACEYDPDNRYQTPAEFLEKLESLRDEDLEPRNIVTEEDVTVLIDPMDDEAEHVLFENMEKEVLKREGLKEEGLKEESGLTTTKPIGKILVPIFATVLILSFALIVFYFVSNRPVNEDNILRKGRIAKLTAKEPAYNGLTVDDITQDELTDNEPRDIDSDDTNQEEENQEDDILPIPEQETKVPTYKVEMDHLDLDTYSSIKNINMLTSLSISFNRLNSLEELKDSVWLDYLSFQNNSIKELDALNNMKNLTCLNGGSNQISDLSPISNLTSLEILILSNNKISDISAIQNLESLTELRLDGNKDIIDITAISYLENLERLILSDTGVKEISPLYELSNLAFVDLSNNDISIEQIENLKSKIPDCTVIY